MLLHAGRSLPLSQSASAAPLAAASRLPAPIELLSPSSLSFVSSSLALLLDLAPRPFTSSPGSSGSRKAPFKEDGEGSTARGATETKHRKNSGQEQANEEGLLPSSPAKQESPFAQATGSRLQTVQPAPVFPHNKFPRETRALAPAKTILVNFHLLVNFILSGVPPLPVVFSFLPGCSCCCLHRRPNP